ncbi:signal transduction histidine kinase [Thermocatellispora tengchongensis]|uniref:histidine kinase n=1 Tax=Thermocatellispora tengchongensis TaxID=1073253 RepID=A0A840PHC7_9ACTN|nr:nitrate- and nitrite sensing domain-containing protein [Thermocatellispora tengchongensis]MBB5138246.1 signal transduction histidine kinase [Thermocatellispora tengchongensis]
MTALILVPTLVSVWLAGSSVIESVDRVTAFERTEAAAEYAQNIRDLAVALGEERDMSQWAIYRKVATLNGKRVRLATEVTTRQKATDTLITRVKADFDKIDPSFGARVVEAKEQSLIQLNGLADVRKETPVRVAPYTSLITSLLRVHDELITVASDPETVGDFRGLSALAHAKEEASKQRVRLVIGAFQPALVTDQELEDFIASRSRQGQRLAEFTAEAGAENVAFLNSTLTNAQRYRAELTKQRAITIQVTSARVAQGALVSDVGQWFDDNTVTIDLIGQIEKRVAEDVVTRLDSLAGTAQRNAATAGAFIVVLLLLVLALTVFIARSMVSPLRRLRTEALEVAGFRLPNVVREMRVTGDATPPEIQPISVTSTDEIGEVAQAFDEVHRQAVRLAAEEAELRSNISSMFVNLSRRTQTLVERQISLIDGLEKGEEDGKRLGDLFKLDHLATRMRRNSENLLVLAGHEPTRRRSQPAKLVDVVRASLSEVEDYERVQVKVHRGTSVVGSAANDIVHLIAELVENAIQFSPRNTQVVVSSSLIEGGGALLSVSDSGIGMTEEELVEANRRLAEPPVVDVSVSRRMGLFVVGRLALRHGIRAQLRPAEGNGLIAMVLIPPALIVDTSQQQSGAPQGTGWSSTQGQPQPGAPVPAGNGAGQPQGFGPFQPGGQAGNQSLFGSDTLMRREAFGQPAGGQGRGFGAPQQPVGGPRAFGGGPASGDPFDQIKDPFASQGSDPFSKVDPFNSHAGDPFASQGGDPFASQAGDPFASQGSDPFAGRGGQFPGQSGDPFAGQGGDPFASQSGDPFASQGNDPFTSQGSDPFARGGADASGSFGGRPAAPRQDTGVFGRPPSAGDAGGFGRGAGVSDPGFGRSMPSDPGFGRQAPSDPGFGREAGGGFSRDGYPSGEPARSSQPFSAWTSHDDDPITASMPAVEVSPLEPEEEEYLPIFASVESAWFRRADVAAPEMSEAERAERAKREENERLEEWESARAAVSTSREPLPTRGAPRAEDWRTPADEGWRAAAAAAEPTLGGITAAGLPKRTPKANLVPGRVAAPPAAAAPPMPPISAERVRNRMASLQQGVRRGRAEVRDESLGKREKEEG